MSQSAFCFTSCATIDGVTATEVASTLVGYARVSTSDQSPDLQIDALRQSGCAKVFTDKASGSLAERPQLTAALEYLRAGDTLVVWRIDRLGRSLPHLVQTVLALQERGVGFRSLNESIDTTTPGGRLVFHLFAALAEFERDLIRERTRAGLVAARSRGRVGGRKPVLTPEKAAAAKRMYDSRDVPISEIARVLGVSRATLYRSLGAANSKTSGAEASA